MRKVLGIHCFSRFWDGGDEGLPNIHLARDSSGKFWTNWPMVQGEGMFSGARRLPELQLALLRVPHSAGETTEVGCI